MAAERFDLFMAKANAAYYGAQEFAHDFATAPEMTQVFGELLGAWAQTAWRMMGAPEDAILVEAGPGRGTLMADALRTWPDPPPVYFLETSAKLRDETRRRVPQARFIYDLIDLPEKPTILLGNEFLDALPVRQFVKRRDGWMERWVDQGAYIERPVDVMLPDDRVGSVRELNEAAFSFCAELSRREAIALFIDYGPMNSAPGESVQAIRHGRPADPLAFPGEADITAHVDFAEIKRRFHAQGPVKMNAFLTALGLFQRTDALALNNPEAAGELRAAARRLTAPEAMGSLFKVIALCPKDFPPLPGFEE